MTLILEPLIIVIKTKLLAADCFQYYTTCKTRSVGATVCYYKLLILLEFKMP
jgi:hypothetical protein